MAAGMSETTRGADERASPDLSEAAGASAVAAVLSGLGLFVLVMTLQPFQSPPPIQEAEPSGGNIVNQIGYVTLGIVYLAAILRLTTQPVLSRLGSASWFLVFAIAAFSTTRALDQEASLRALMLAAITMVVVAGVLVLPATERQFANAAANAVLAIMLIVYAVLLLAPSLAVHSAEGAEGVHVGDWRGHLSHKNYAAPVFSMLTMVGIYCWRMGFRLRGLTIAALGLIFVVNSGSKTTAGFLPVAIGLVYLIRLTGRPGLVLAIHAGLVALVAALTVGTVLSPALLGLTRDLIADPTFTGRDEIWKFATRHIAERPWLGYGYVSFWQTPLVTTLEENTEASWDIRGIGSGHNSYLDAMLMFGIPGGAVITYLLMINPLRHYLAAYQVRANRNLADLFASIVIFMTYIGMLESFVLNRSDPLWILFAMAVLGLEFLSRMRARQG